MRRLLFLIAFISMPLLADGPAYKHKDASIQKEFDNAYQDIRTIRNALNPLKISSGTVSCLTVSTLTVTNLVATNDVCSSFVTSYGAVGNGINDDTSAFQAAMDGLPVGGKLCIPTPPNAYKITSQLSLLNVNRITIQGEGTETNLNFTPNAAGTRLFSVDGSLDNVTFRDFSVTQTNPTTQPNTSAFVVGSGATKITWDRVYFTSFGRFGINLGAGVYYINIRNCRFIRIRDTTSSVSPFAIFTSGSNDFTVQDCQFSENDGNINVAAGARGAIIRNAMEVDGNSGNANIGYMIQLTSTINFEIVNNYIEGEYTNGSAIIRLNNCKNTWIRENYFNGQDSNVDKTDTTITVLGTSSFNIQIDNNNFVETKTYFIDASVPVKAHGNYYLDGGVQLSSAATICPYFSDPTQVDLDALTYKTWDPASLASGSGETSPDFVVSGSSTGDTVEVYPPYDVKGMTFTGYVQTSTGTVKIRLQNQTGSTIDLASGNWAVRIRKPFGSL